jgi:cobalamin biosynthesis protein CobT
MAAIKAIEFERGTITAAKTLSSDFKVDVVFAGEKAQTSDKVIMLPAIEEGSELNTEEAKIIRGYTDHEIIHKVITNFEAGKTVRKGIDQFHDKMMQAIEDVRVDHAGTQMYYGVKDNLEATANAVADQLWERIKEDPSIAKDVKSMAPYAITLAGRMKMGQDIKNGENILDAMHPQARQLVEDLAEEALAVPTGVTGPGAVDKKDAYAGFSKGIELADTAFKVFMERLGEFEEPEGGGGSGKGSGSAPPGAGESGGEEGDQEGGSAPEGNPDPLDVDAAQTINKMLKSKRKKSKSGYVRPPLNFDLVLNREGWIDYVANRRGKASSEVVNKYIEAGRQNYMAVLSKANSTLSVLKAQMERAILAQDKGDREESTAGRLNRRRLVPAIKGRDTVFTRKSMDFELNTAVQLVVDMSGSMSGTKIMLAQQSAILLGEALQKCNVPFEVVGFTTTHALTKTSRISAELGLEPSTVTFSRDEPILFVNFKSFTERLHQSHGAMGHMGARSNNVDGESLLYAWESLSKRPEKRKIMIVLSDGYPAFACTAHGYEDHRYHKHVKDVVAHISKSAEVLGIGIEDGAVAAFYPNHVVIKSAEQLPSLVLTKLTKMISKHH